MRAFATVLAIPLAWAVCFATFAAVGMDALVAEGRGQDRRCADDAAGRDRAAVDHRDRAENADADGDARRRRRRRLHRTDGELSRRPSRGRRAWRRPYLPASADTGPHTAAATSTHEHNGGEQRTPGTRRAVGPSDRLRAGDLAPSARRRRSRDGEPGSCRRRERRRGRGGQSGGWKPPKGFEQSTGGPGGAGLRNPSWQEIKDHVPVELAAAGARRSATTRGDVAGAMRALSPDAQRGVLALMETKSGQIRGEMAYQAARSDLGDADRDAFRTLAAASPEVRVQGIGDFVDGAPVEPVAPLRRHRRPHAILGGRRRRRPRPCLTAGRWGRPPSRDRRLRRSAARRTPRAAPRRRPDAATTRSPTRRSP